MAPRSLSTISAARSTEPVATLSPAQEVVEEIKGMGAEAIANGDDVSDWEGAQRMVEHRPSRPSAGSTSSSTTQAFSATAC